MNLRRKLFFDRLGLLSIPFLLPLSVISRLTSLFRSQFEQTEEVGIIKLIGGGNAIMLSDSIRALHLYQTKVTLITLKSNRYLVDACGLTKHVLYLDDSGFLSLIFSTLYFISTKFGRFSLLVDLEIHSKSTSILTRLMGVIKIHEFVLPTVALRDSAFVKRHHLDKSESLPRYYQDYLLREIFKIDVMEKVSPRYAEVSKEGSRRSDYITVAATCSDFLRYRMLLVSEWSLLIRPSLSPNVKRIVLIGGGPFDRAYNTKLKLELQREFPSLEILDLTNEVQASDMASFIEKSLKFFSVDSGLMHLSFTVNVPRVICWGPTAPNTRIWGYGFFNTINIYRDYHCSPCVNIITDPLCGGSAPCIRSIFRKS